MSAEVFDVLDMFICAADEFDMFIGPEVFNYDPDKFTAGLRPDMLLTWLSSVATPLLLA